MFDFKGKSVIVTGGSRGLGRALAERLAAEGARVVVVARHKEDLDEVVDGIGARGGVAFGVVADVGDKESVYPIAGQAAALIGPADILINNASILGPVPLRLLPDTDCEEFERVLQVNTVGPFRLMKAVLGSMALREGGLIVNISSDAAVEAYSSWGAYSASKAALDQLTRFAAAELSETGVRLFSIDPGEMRTQMHADAMPDADATLLERPEAVAETIVGILRQSPQIESGSRLVASDWKASR